jgi:branched-chain amino acid aminotransferase
MNAAGKVSEGSAMNIFVVRNGIIRTPAVTEDILEGITRASVIELARHKGYTVVEGQIDKSELLVADEVFFTGTAARITPVRAIEYYQLPEVKPICSDLKESLESILLGNDPHFSHWITRIPLH